MRHKFPLSCLAVCPQELLELEQLAREAEMASLAQEEQQQCRKELADLEVWPLPLPISCSSDSSLTPP